MSFTLSQGNKDFVFRNNIDEGALISNFSNVDFMKTTQRHPTKYETKRSMLFLILVQRSFSVLTFL